MLKYQLINFNFAIVEDPDHLIDVDLINPQVDLYLRINNMIPPETPPLSRVVRDGDIVTFNGHALYGAENMMNLIPPNIKLEHNHQLVEKYKTSRLPDFNILTTEQRNGPAAHTTSIDKGIKSLVAAINTIPGAKTFASCDGHGYKFAYVLFEAQDIHWTILIIDNALCKARPRYTFKNLIVNYHLSLDSWKSARGDMLTYEIRIHYHPEEYKEVMKFINESAKNIEEIVNEKI